MKHKILFLILLLIAVPIYMIAQEVKINGIRYKLFDNDSNHGGSYAEVASQELSRKELKKYTGEVVIPDSVEYKKRKYCVKVIGNQAFSFCTNLISISIPNSVTEIGQEAFQYCIRLTSIAIPNGVTNIGRYAFKHCTGLTSVNIPNCETEISYKAFEGCTGLISATIFPPSKRNKFSGKIEWIWREVFVDCTGPTSITIPDGVKKIPPRAFERLEQLTSVTIPNSVSSIGDYAFSGCSGLTNVTIPNSVSSIGVCAFSGCSSLTNVTIPSSVTKISDSAFGGCTGLTSVTIPDGVTSIGSDAFNGCASLTSVTIPSSVTKIGFRAFQNCTGLTSISIPYSVTAIALWAFEGTKLKSITIENPYIEVADDYFGGTSFGSVPNDAVVKFGGRVISANQLPGTENHAQMKQIEAERTFDERNAQFEAQYEANKRARQARISQLERALGGVSPRSTIKEVVKTGRSFSMVKEYLNLVTNGGWFFELRTDNGSRKSYFVCYINDDLSHSRSGHVWVANGKIYQVSWYR